jgi:hypothetical protein
MIAISKTTQATGDGAAIIFQELPQSRLRNEAARVSRSATLDGGCVIDHQGFSDSDRTFDIRTKETRERANILWGLFTSQAFLNISTPEGFFYGVIENMADENGNVRLSILVKE